MQGQDRVVKVVFSDNDINKAITGTVIGEDEFFIIIKGNDRTYRIGKKVIVCIEEKGGIAKGEGGVF